MIALKTEVEIYREYSAGASSRSLAEKFNIPVNRTRKAITKIRRKAKRAVGPGAKGRQSTPVSVYEETEITRDIVFEYRPGDD